MSIRRQSESRRPSRVARWLAVLILGALVRPGAAADLKAEVSSTDVSVGLPFTFTITIDYTDETAAPAFPVVAGLRLVGPPSRSTLENRGFYNGRTTIRRTLTCVYTLVPETTGAITIPPIEIEADDSIFTTAPVTVVATEPRASEELFVEIVPERAAVTLGEPIDLTLYVWIKPFNSPQLGGAINSASMWSRVDLGQSNWGDFFEPMRELAGGLRLRAPGVEQAPREDADGKQQLFYRFSVTRRVWPEQAGAFEPLPVAVLIDYPLRLARSRDLLSRGNWTVAQSRIIAAAAERPTIDVRPPPAEDRPPYFIGAVGRFELEVTAKPTEVAVGDPITLQMTVTDRTVGGTRLDVLPPPPLAAVPGLADGFRVPSDPLAGVVTGRRKVFTQTIRAQHDRVKAIPPIPFAYFDPREQRYDVAWSDPIALDVRRAPTLSMADVVGGDAVDGGAETELTEVAGGILANVSGADELLASHAFVPRWGHAAAVFAPPFLFVLLAVTHHRARKLRHDTGYARRRGARRNAIRRITRAKRAEEDHLSERIAAALSEYVADRSGAAPGVMTRTEVIETLRKSGVGEGLRTEVEALLAECEHARFAGAAPVNGETLPERAEQCVKRLERERLR